MRIFWGLRKYRWFVLGVLFLLLNGYGLFRWIARAQGEAGRTDPSAPAAMLGLTKIEPVVEDDEGGQIRASFTLPVDCGAADGFVEVRPKMAFTIEPYDDWQSTGCRLVGEFQPGAVYEVIFRQGLKSTAGAKLPTDLKRRVYFPDRQASIAIHTSGQYLSTQSNLLLPVSTVNVRSFKLMIERVYPNNLVYFGQRQSLSYRPHENLSHVVAMKDFVVAGKPNAAVETMVDLRELLRDTPSGTFNVTVDPDKGESASHPVVVTDIGIALKRGAHELLVWANSIHDVAAVTNAEVRIFTRTNQEIGHGVTDTNGLARFELEETDSEREPFLVTVARGDELSYLKLEGARVEPVGDVEGRPYLRAGWEAYVFTDRGIYRPGETAHVKAIVRGPETACPSSVTVQLNVLRPDGRRGKLLTATLGEYGSAEFAVEWPDYAATGRYRLQLKRTDGEEVIGQTTVAVEEFVPPQIAVNVDGATTRVRGSESFSFTVAARHLFGRPAAGCPVNGVVEFVPESFSPHNWAGYIFGDAERNFQTVRAELGKATLDADGKAQFIARSSADWRPAAAVKAVFLASVMETGGRTVSAYGTRMVDVYPFYLGIEESVGRQQILTGQPQSIGVVAVRSDGAAENGIANLFWTLHKVSWVTVLRKDSGKRFHFESERHLTEVQRQTVALTNGVGRLTFTPTQAGQHLLVVHDAQTNVSSSATFYVRGENQEWVAWATEQPGRVDLQLDRDSYRVGDQARLLIKAPFAGKALLTVESDRVLDQQIISMEKNTAEVSIPVTAACLPNAYCTITLVRPVKAGEMWTAHRAVGNIPLVVSAADKRLQVKLSAPPQIRPQQKLRVPIEVTDADGRGVVSEVVVAAVDEGICAVTEFACPDPLAFFGGKRRLEVDLFDLYALLMPEVDADRAGGTSEPGGDDDKATMLRRRLNPIKARRFKPVALWCSNVTTDAAGRALVELDVPEFSGELRLMAVAIGRDRFGCVQQPVLVKRPLIVRSSLPRFLAPGDVCTMPVQVFNETGQDGEAIIHVTGRGVSVRARTGAGRPGDYELVASPTAGVSRVGLDVTLGAERYTEEFELPVRPPAGLTVTGGVGSVVSGATATIRLPEGWLPGTERYELSCSGRPGIKLGGAIQYLLRYPYGCLEQTTSSAFPLLYLADLAAQAQPGSMGQEEVTHHVQAGIDRVLSMQLASGGFSLWPQSREVYGWGSIYATHFLAEALKAGYPVPKDRLNAACDYLVSLLATNDPGQRAYVCRVLAVAGKPQAGWMTRLQEQKDMLDFSARVDLAAALAAARKRREAGDLLSSLGAGAPTATPHEPGGWLNSDVRNTALLLSAWLDLDTEQPVIAALVQRLESANQGGAWYTTQENALALLALGRYARLTDTQRKPFRALVKQSGKTLGEFTHEQNLRLGLEANDEPVLQIINTGPGTAYYYWRAEGVPATGQRPRSDNGLRVRRRLLDLNGAPLDGGRFKQGDLLVVEITLDSGATQLDNVVVEDLLPAGFEIENADLKTAQLVSWLSEKQTLPLRHRELRDDRLLLFTGRFRGRQVYYYAARAVTIGRYIYPAVTASCMYDPNISSTDGPGHAEVE